MKTLLEGWVDSWLRVICYRTLDGYRLTTPQGEIPGYTGDEMAAFRCLGCNEAIGFYQLCRICSCPHCGARYRVRLSHRERTVHLEPTHAA